MRKLFIAASSALLGSVDAAEGSTSEAIEPFFRRYFKKLYLCAIFRRNTRVVDNVELQSADEENCVSGKNQSVLYDLATNNPHVIATSLFSTKRR